MQESFTIKTMTCDVCKNVQKSTGKITGIVTRSISVRGPGVIDSDEIEMCMRCWTRFVVNPDSSSESQCIPIFLASLRKAVILHLQHEIAV